MKSITAAATVLALALGVVLAGGVDARTRVQNFVCRFGGTTIARLRCAHRTRDRAMKAKWGD